MNTNHGIRALKVLQPIVKTLPKPSIRIRASGGKITLDADDGEVNLSITLDGTRDGVVGSLVSDYGALIDPDMLRKTLEGLSIGRTDNVPVAFNVISFPEMKKDEEEPGRLIIGNVKRRYEVPFISDREYPSTRVPGEHESMVKIAAAELADALDYAMIAASDDYTRQNIQHLQLGTDGTLVATDGHRLHVSRLSVPLVKTKAGLIHARVFATLRTFIQQFQPTAISFAVHENVYAFVATLPGVEMHFVTPRMEDNYAFPDYLQVVESNEAARRTFTVKTAALRDALRAATKIDPVIGCVVLSTDSTKLSLRARSDVLSGPLTTFEETLPIVTQSEFNSGTFDVAASINYLLESLKHDETTRLTIQDELSAVLVFPTEEQMAVVMPMSNPEKPKSAEKT